MFLSDTQKQEIIFELKAASRDDLVKEIKENGAEAQILDFTDVDNQQLCIKLSEDVYVYSQQSKFFYDWNTDNEIDVEEYYTDTIDLSMLTEKEIKSGISAFYGSIDKIQKIHGDDYKQIIAECIFETNAM
jgi:hypothetical protein